MAQVDEAEHSGEPGGGKGWGRVFLSVLSLTLLLVVVVCCGGPFMIGAGMNPITTHVSEIDETWVVADVARRGDEVSAMPIKNALEHQCWPMQNGIRVLFNHLWYNAITSGYDGQIHLEARGKGFEMYILYIWGNNVYLRDEASPGGYVNRVLSCELDYDAWSRLTEPAMRGEVIDE